MYWRQKLKNWISWYRQIKHETLKDCTSINYSGCPPVIKGTRLEMSSSKSNCESHVSTTKVTKPPPPVDHQTQKMSPDHYAYAASYLETLEIVRNMGGIWWNIPSRHVFLAQKLDIWLHPSIWSQSSLSHNIWLEFASHAIPHSDHLSLQRIRSTLAKTCRDLSRWNSPSKLLPVFRTEHQISRILRWKQVDSSPSCIDII